MGTAPKAAAGGKGFAYVCPWGGGGHGGDGRGRPAESSLPQHVHLMEWQRGKRAKYEALADAGRAGWEEQLANGVRAGNKKLFRYIRGKEAAKKSAGPRAGEDVRGTLSEGKVTQMNYLQHHSQAELSRSLCQSSSLGLGLWETFQTETSISSRSKAAGPRGSSWGDVRNPEVEPLN